MKSIAVIISVFIVMAIGAVTPVRAALQCYDCHGTNGTGDYRPDDAAYRNISTGAFKGNHRSHMGSDATADNCTVCHGSEVTSYTAAHRDGDVTMSPNINSSVTPASYSRGASFAQSATPTLGTCSYVNCHFESATPPWNGAAFSSPTDCNRCHGAAPNTGSHPVTGAKHAAYYGTTTACCSRCHPAHAAEGSPFAHATSAGKRNLSITFSSLPNAGSGTYSGALNDYLPSQSNTFGTCIATYCHSPGNKGSAFDAPNQAAAWGGSLTCKGCHKGDKPSGDAMASGGHGKHVASFGINCVRCHKASVTDSNTIGTYANHVNKLVNVSFDSTTTAVIGTARYNGVIAPMTKAPGSAYGQCTNLYCHSTVQGAGGVGAPANYGTPTWGASAVCNGCHREGGGHGGVAADGSSAPIASGSHTKHLSYSYGLSGSSIKCVVCHKWDASKTLDDDCANCHGTPQYAKHVNYQVNVAFDSTFGAGTYNGTLKPGDGYSNCANTYCHSNGTSVSSGSVPANTSVNWGTAGPLACNSCHGNATYGSDYRKGAPLYSSGSPKGNAHGSHIRTGTLSGDYMQCYNCHASTTRNSTSIANTANHINRTYNIAASVFGVFSSEFRDGDNTMNSTKVTLTHSYNASGSSCSNVSCHPVGLDVTTNPSTPKTRATSSVTWDNKGLCIDCHNIDMQSTNTFHHAMRNYSSGYPLQSPYSSASTGVNAYARRCTMCHVNHNIFSPDLNASNTMGRGGNLRTDIAVAPTASSGYANTDFIKSAGGAGGICISCHSTAKTKDTTRRRNDSPANSTPVITQAQYSSSGHQYDVSAKFMSDGSTVYGNCSKCHNALMNETSVFMNATSLYSFGNHNSGIRRLQGALDAAGGETAEEQICYRCHSQTTDDDPGGGPPKTVANKDFYGVAPMSLAAEDIFSANRDFRTANSTYSTTNKLYFRPSAAGTPAEPMPNQHNTGDTFAGGTWIGRSMAPWETTTAYETKSQTTNAVGTNYWRMVTFTSPAVYSTTTVPAGIWVINIYCRESSTAQNAKIRYMVYKWNANDTVGTTIIGKATYATELATTAAPGAVRQIAVSVGAVTLNAGQKIAVDLELDTTATYTTSYTASFYFGSHAPSDLTLPGNVPWSYADPGAEGFGHATQHFAGVHLPSTRNETLAYIAQNKHVECVDCHNPHATRNGLHGDYGIATGGSSTTLVNSNKSWVPNYWTGDYVSLVSDSLGTTTPVARITGNTATTLTTTPYTGTWVAPVAGNVYRIIANTNKVSRTQRGVPGASVSYSGAWVNGTYSMVEESTYEYQICFKCHASTGTTHNTMRYWNMTSASLGAARWTNVGLEFNPNNVSYHPVIQPLPETGNRRLNAAALTGGWAPGEVMSCSDCHGRDTSTSATAQGPHGSTVKWLLTGKYQNWPFTSAAANGTAAGGTLLIGTGTTTYPAANFCFNCHTWAAGGYGHTKSSGGHNKACVNCHIRVPHGGKVPRLLTGVNVPPRYKPDGNGGAFSGSYLTSAQLPATGYMGANDVSCTTICGARHTNNTTKTYSW